MLVLVMKVFCREGQASTIMFIVLYQITDMAPDAVACCSLVRRLAFRLTDGIAAGTIPITVKAAEDVRLHATAGVCVAAGESDI